MTRPPPVVLLCGGLGLRQRSDGDDLPKPMRLLPDGRPLLLHVVDYYRRFGVREFVLCVGYGADAITRLLVETFADNLAQTATGAGWLRISGADLRITLVDDGPYAEKNTRLLTARGHLDDEPFLLGYADVLSDLDLDRLIDRHRGTDAALTLVATRVRSRYGELRVDEACRVTEFHEKPTRTALVSAGYFMCSPQMFDVLRPELDFEVDVLPQLTASGRVGAVVHEGLWLPFDTYKDFIDAEDLVAREGFRWLNPA
ncbi:sugar phosphate nucleotidyltransferase [Micromonospora echinospora]